jgi:hypothetical protein
MKFSIGFTVEEDPRTIDRLNRSENYRTDMLQYLADLLADPRRSCTLKLASRRTIEIQAYLPPARTLFDDIAEDTDATGGVDERELQEQEA